MDANKKKNTNEWKVAKENNEMKKIILGGLIFVGGTIMYSIGTLGFADMDVQAGYMLTPQYIGVAVMLLGLALGIWGLKED